MSAERAKKSADPGTYSGRCAARLRQLRREAGLSVEELAKRLSTAGYSVSVPTIYHWENGTRRIDLDAIPALAKALKVAPHKLLPDK